MIDSGLLIMKELLRATIMDNAYSQPSKYMDHLLLHTTKFVAINTVDKARTEQYIREKILRTFIAFFH